MNSFGTSTSLVVDHVDLVGGETAELAALEQATTTLRLLSSFFLKNRAISVSFQKFDVSIAVPVACCCGFFAARTGHLTSDPGGAACNHFAESPRPTAGTSI